MRPRIRNEDETWNELDVMGLTLIDGCYKETATEPITNARGKL